MTDRRADIDWLRVLAVLLVFLTHAAQVFSPLDDWHIADPEPSRLLGQFTVLMAPWIMPLFMMLAGMSAWFALRRRGPRTFVGERAFKVFVPLVAGTLLVVPPQVYLRRLSRGEFDGSYLEFYPHFFDGIYPTGNFSYGHLWFLAYLFTYMLAGLPFFVWMARPGGQRVLSLLARTTDLPGGILWLFVPLALGQILLRPFFPDTTGAVVGDWSTHAWLFPLYLLGFATLAEPRLEAAIARDWRSAFFPAVLTSLGLLAFAWPGAALERIPTDPSAWHVIFWTGFTLSTWAWIVLFLGAARSWLSSSSPLLEWARVRVFPFYIFHQTAIVVAAYHVVRWPVPLWARFGLTVILGGFLTLAAVELVRATGWGGRLFGVRRGGRPLSRPG